MNIQEKTRSSKIQVLRGISIIAVVFIHNTPEGTWSVVLKPFLNFSVGMFLFLSGFLSDINNWNPKKRITKVMIPYLIWSLIYTVVYNWNMPKSILKVFLSSLVRGDASAAMYYIFVYCQFTLLIPFINKVAKSKYKYLGFIISPLEIIMMRLLPLLMGYQIPAFIKAVMHVSCLGWFTYFYLGYLIGNNLLQIKGKTSRWILACGGGILLQILEEVWYLSMGSANYGTQLKMSSILTGTFVTLVAYRFLKCDMVVNTKWLQVLGDYSFGIYFSHLAIIWLLNYVPYYTRFVYYPFNAIITIIISMLFCYICKKILRGWGKYFAL